MNRLVAVVALAVLAFMLGVVALHAKEDVATPKEYGVYIKTPKTLKRLLPNIVFDEKGVLYIESNNPQRFPLAEVQQFIIYGKYDTKYLTLNPMLFVSETPLHKSRFIFGKDIQLEVAKKSDTLYTAKPKGLFGRGYYSLWINDTAWDFVIE
ncbi:MAG TPA: hypothetical protein VKF36_19680 [Syntrophorhabdales bacterium]|nr:hypothetical protein [Syntrophorhabdales bacterium]